MSGIKEMLEYLLANDVQADMRKLCAVASDRDPEKKWAKLILALLEGLTDKARELLAKEQAQTPCYSENLLGISPGGKPAPCSCPECPLRSDVSPARRLAGDIRRWLKTAPMNHSDEALLLAILNNCDGQGDIK